MCPSSASSGDTSIKVASYSCYHTVLLSGAVAQRLCVGTNLPSRVITVTEATALLHQAMCTPGHTKRFFKHLLVP